MFKTARVECTMCGHAWQAVQEIDSEDTMLVSLECAKCGHMCGAEPIVESDQDEDSERSKS